MISTRHKPRGWTDAERAFDLTLRREVRGFIRWCIPDMERPPGAGWLLAPAHADHETCGEQLLAVHVPGVDLPGLCYCPTCEQAMLLWAGTA